MNSDEKWVLIGIGIVFAVMVALAFTLPYYKAQTFNKFSKTKVTYWDAFISDLKLIPN